VASISRGRFEHELALKPG